jgi:hypothetical protein
VSLPGQRELPARSEKRQVAARLHMLFESDAHTDEGPKEMLMLTRFVKEILIHSEPRDNLARRIWVPN